MRYFTSLFGNLVFKIGVEFMLHTPQSRLTTPDMLSSWRGNIVG